MNLLEQPEYRFLKMDLYRETIHCSVEDVPLPPGGYLLWRLRRPTAPPPREHPELRQNPPPEQEKGRRHLNKRAMHLMCLGILEKEEIIAWGQCFTLKDLAVNGRDVIAAGVAPGPEVR